MQPIEPHTKRAENLSQYFDSLSGVWEDKYTGKGSMRGRLERFAGKLKTRVYPPASILDFGCGPGDLSWYLASSGYQVAGIDQSKEMVNRARARFNRENLSFTHYDPAAAPKSRLPFEDAYFRACVASSVLEYVSPLEDCLAELRRVVTVGGVLLVTVPNPFHPLRLVESLEIPVLRKSPRLTKIWPNWRLNYLRASVNRLWIPEWRAALNNQGWRVENVTGRADPLVLISASRAS